MEEILRELKERKEYKELSKYLGRSGALRSELIGNVSELCKESKAKNFDEFFEILTLKQLGRHNKAIVILNINGFFNDMLNMMKHAIAKQFITTDCVELYKVAKTAEEALDYIDSINGETASGVDNIEKILVIFTRIFILFLSD